MVRDLSKIDFKTKEVIWEGTKVFPTDPIPLDR